ncbi:MAG: L,D-transpeptidase [Ktedonobacteraceae bacterium]|nr:L,D-transpeptidase [Ktedonobacteraceae bacterium]
MQTRRAVHLKKSVTQALLGGLITALMLLTAACGGDPHAQQQATQGRDQLDKAIRHAVTIGVPASMLQPVRRQAQTLNSTSAPFSLFSDQAATDYYNHQASQYQQLQEQTQTIITTATNQFQTQAQHDMQNFQDALTAQRTKGKGNIQAFTEQFSHDQSLLSTAQYPKDYAVISKEAATYTQALELLPVTYSQLNTFHTTITQMQKAHIDVSAMQTQYQDDMQSFNAAVMPSDFQNLGILLNAQYQQAVVSSIQSLPYVGSAKLNQFQTQLAQLKTYGMNGSAYQKRYDADRAAMSKATTIHAYLVVSQQIDTDMAAMHADLVQGQSYYMVKQIDRQAKDWGNAHLYHDKFDNHNYIVDSGYTLDGIGYWLNRELGWTYATQDYQAVIDEENNQLFNLSMFEQDYSDTTPYNQVHATDLAMFDHYKLYKGQVVVVALAEQAMRLFQDGKLVSSFHVTTGRVERPSLPGVWTVQDRKSPTEFKSTDPPGSPYWYPPTHINYGINYHWGGFFIHDSPWRFDYGPHTQFPHADSSGDVSFSFNGSHGCVNMAENQAAWIYTHTTWNTMIAIY